jgi:hypothetical protein
MTRETTTNQHRFSWAKVVMLPALAMLASQAQAQEPDLEKCLQIADVSERVVCYDSIAQVQRMQRQASAAAPAQAAVQSPPVLAAGTPGRREEFGLSAVEREQARPERPRQLNEIKAVIASSKAVGAGYWQFTTTDGLIWRLAETSRSFRPPRAGDEVRFRRGRLGSYYLDADKQPTMRVVRVD